MSSGEKWVHNFRMFTQCMYYCMIMFTCTSMMCVCVSVSVRFARLPRDGELAAGFTSVALFVTNAAMTPAERVGNTWVWH